MCVVCCVVLLFLLVVCAAVVGGALALPYRVHLQQFEDIFSDLRAILTFP